MIKLLVTEIHNCETCSNKRIDTINYMFHLFKNYCYLDKDKKKIDDITTIPEWCPLPTKKTKKRVKK